MQRESRSSATRRLASTALGLLLIAVACAREAQVPPVALSTTAAALTPGSPAWTARVGGSGNDQLNGVALDSTGAVLATGFASTEVDGQANAGSTDGLLTKSSASGSRLWTRLAGTSQADAFNAVAVGASDSVYVAGYLRGELDGQPNLGGPDLWLSKYDASGTRLWTRTNGSSATDAANAVAVNGGGIYVAGYTGKSLPGSAAAGRTDVALLRYDESGGLTWATSFGTTQDEAANGVAVDASGNAYVAGTTSGAFAGNTSAGGKDIFLAKLNAAGGVVWTKQVGTSADDNGTGVTIGPDGNIYVSGFTGGALGGTAAGSTDAVLLKFDPGGTLLWSRQLGGAATDEGLAVATDGVSLFLSGRSLGQLPGANAGGLLNLFAAKYAPDGTLQTVREYSGGNQTGATLSTGVAATNGRLVVVGATTALQFDGVSGLGNSDGVVLSLCSGNNFACQLAGSCAVNRGGCTATQTCTPDGAGAVLCGCQAGQTGSIACFDVNECLVSNGGCDPVTTCTNTNGSRTCGACPAGYTGTGATGCIDIDECATNGGGCPLSCINTPGSFHCGCSAGYSGDGESCTDLDECATNNGGCDVLTTCTNTTGSFTCGACPSGYTGNGATGCFDVDECATDNGGCAAYLTCRNTVGARVCECPSGLVDYHGACVVLRPAWTARVGASGADQVNAVALDSSANILVGGFASTSVDGQPTAGGQDGLLTKYSTSGARQWTRLAGSTQVDAINGVAVGSSDSIYVAGYLRGPLDGQPNLGGQDLWLSKYDAGGTRLWTRTIGSTENDLANAVAVRAGSVVVAGLTTRALPGSTALGGNDIAVARYDESGALSWARSFGSNLDDAATGIALDESGNLYVAGSTSGTLPDNTSAGAKDMFLAKLSPSGATLWTKQFGTASDDTATGVVLGADGGLYVSGSTAGALGGAAAGSTDAVLVKFDASGTRLWTRQLGGAATDEGLGVAGDDGAVYLTGRSLGQLPGANPGGLQNLFAAKYGFDGTLLTVREYSGGNASGNTFSAAAAARNGRLLLGGGTTAAQFDGVNGFGGSDGLILNLCSDNNFACELAGSCSTGNGGCTASQTCTPAGAGFVQCSCRSGFTGSVVCADVNECLVQNGACDPLTTCANTSGSRTCGVCPSGYTGSGATGCVPINNCLTANGGCDVQGVCTMTGPATNSCACETGYSGSGAVGDCSPINDCLTANGGCDTHASCTMTGPGTHSCACEAGYSGSGVAGDCTAADPCETGNGGCAPEGICTATGPETRSCSCGAGAGAGGLITTQTLPLAGLSGPAGVARDGAGNLYIADTGHHVIRVVDAAGVMSVFAGTGNPGDREGDRSVAEFVAPYSLLFDHSGSLWVGDVGTQTLLRIDVSGQVQRMESSIVARQMAMDATGTVYLVDSASHTVRSFDPGATDKFKATYWAGGLPAGNRNGYRTVASFSSPSGIAIDPQGVIYVADSGNNVIRRIEQEWVSTFVGSGERGDQDGPGPQAAFANPQGLTLDSQGFLAVADRGNARVRLIDPSRVVTTLAGSGVTGSIDAEAGAAQFDGLLGVYAEMNDELLVISEGGLRRIPRLEGCRPANVCLTDNGGCGAHAVCRYAGNGAHTCACETGYAETEAGCIPIDRCAEPDAGACVANATCVSTQPGENICQCAAGHAGPGAQGVFWWMNTLAGNGASGSTDGTGGPEGTAAFSAPMAFATGPAGTVYVLESSGLVRLIDATGNVTTPAWNADSAIACPGPITVDAMGNVFLADCDAIKRVAPDGTVSEFVATAGDVTAMAIDPGGALVYASSTDCTLHKAAPDQTATWFAGNGLCLDADGPALTAGFDVPRSISFDAEGNAIVAEAGGRVRSVSPNGLVTTIADFFGMPLIDAELDARGTLYILGAADTGLLRYRPGDPFNTPLVTSAPGFADGPLDAGAAYSNASALALAASGDLLLLDSGNNRVRTLPANRDCEPINPCEDGTNGGCVNGTCSMTGPGERVCSCAQNYDLIDGAVCVGHDNCQDPDFGGCAAPEYCQMSGPATNECSSCYSNHGGCFSEAECIPTTESTNTCQCQPGFSGPAQSVVTRSVPFADVDGPTAVAVDQSGQAVVVWPYVLGFLSPGGAVTPVPIPFVEDPTSLVFNAGGDLLIGDRAAGGVWDVSGHFISLGFGPTQMAAAPDGSLYAVNPIANAIVRIDPAHQVTWLASTERGSADGPLASARFSGPAGIVMDPAGNLLISELTSGRIRRIGTDGQVTTVVGSSAGFFFPWNLALDGQGFLFVTDQLNHRIRQVDPAWNVWTIAGSGAPGLKDGAALEAEFAQPGSLALTPAGGLYVANRDGYYPLRFIPREQGCLPVNTCAVDAGGCDANAVCAYTRPGTNSCTCNDGYLPFGAACVADPCLVDHGGCDANASCSGTPEGVAACGCPAGLFGDGRVDGEGCRGSCSTCDAHATCSNSGLRDVPATCTCDEDYEGDGQTCSHRRFVLNGETAFDPAAAAEQNIGLPLGMGTVFSTTAAGRAVGMRYYRSDSMYAVRVGYLWDPSDPGVPLATVTFDGAETGWSEAQFSEPVTLTPDHDYVVSVDHEDGYFVEDCGRFDDQVSVGGIHYPADWTTPNGLLDDRLGALPQYPSWVRGASGCFYFVDINILPDDPCGVSNGGCDAHASCQLGEENTRCTCDERYVGDGRTCAPRDLCLTDNGGCDPNASCTMNGVGSVLCECNAGYLTFGATCVADPCLVDHGGCDANASCSGTAAGAAACTCPAGFSGDGRVEGEGCSGDCSACDAHATCSNAGLRDVPATCTCDEGYFGAGQTCTRPGFILNGEAAVDPGAGYEKNNGTPMGVGTVFSTTAAGRAVGMRYYRTDSMSAVRVGHLWDPSDASAPLATVTFDGTATGWNEAWFSAPVALVPHQYYVVSIDHPDGYYLEQCFVFTTQVSVRGLEYPADSSISNGRWSFDSGTLPGNGASGCSFLVDINFVADDPCDVSNGGCDPQASCAVGEESTLCTCDSGYLGDGHGCARPGVVLNGEGAFDAAGGVELNLGQSIELGTVFSPTVAGRAVGMRYYRSDAMSSTRVGYLWDLSATSEPLATVAFDATPTGWSEASFDAPVALTPNHYYVVSIDHEDGYYFQQCGRLNATVRVEGLEYPADSTTPNGLWSFGTGTFPAIGNTACYNYVDVNFVVDP